MTAREILAALPSSDRERIWAEAQKARNPLAYVWVAARNWRADEARKAAALPRKLARARQKAERAAEAAQAVASDVAAREELLRLLTGPQTPAREYLRRRVAEGLTDPEAAVYFPGTTRDQRYQWKHREASRLIQAGECSPNLVRFLRIKD